VTVTYFQFALRFICSFPLFVEEQQEKLRTKLSKITELSLITFGGFYLKFRIRVAHRHRHVFSVCPTFHLLLPVIRRRATGEITYEAEQNN
jgi:hypothetical protein